MVLSAFMNPAIGHNGDTVTFSYDGPENLSMAPDGGWGISWFVSGEDCELYTFFDGVPQVQAFPLNEVDIISSITIDPNYILVSGSSSDENDSDHYLFAYDHTGTLLRKMGGEPGGFGLGSISYAISTENGFLGLDANMREVVLWAGDGTWIGAADDGELFGTDYPWIAAADRAPDGSIFVVMCEERPDESADEVIVFRLKGF